MKTMADKTPQAWNAVRSTGKTECGNVKKPYGMNTKNDTYTGSHSAWKPIASSTNEGWMILGALLGQSEAKV